MVEHDRQIATFLYAKRGVHLLVDVIKGQGTVVQERHEMQLHTTVVFISLCLKGNLQLPLPFSFCNSNKNSNLCLCISLYNSIMKREGGIGEVGNGPALTAWILLSDAGTEPHWSLLSQYSLCSSKAFC